MTTFFGLCLAQEAIPTCPCGEVEDADYTCVITLDIRLPASLLQALEEDPPNTSPIMQSLLKEGHLKIHSAATGYYDLHYLTPWDNQEEFHEANVTIGQRSLQVVLNDKTLTNTTLPAIESPFQAVIDDDFDLRSLTPDLTLLEHLVDEDICECSLMNTLIGTEYGMIEGAIFMVGWWDDLLRTVETQEDVLRCEWDHTGDWLCEIRGASLDPVWLIFEVALMSDNDLDHLDVQVIDHHTQGRGWCRLDNGLHGTMEMTDTFKILTTYGLEEAVSTLTVRQSLINPDILE